MIKLSKFNVFTILMTVAVFALVLRVANIASFTTTPSVAESAKEDKKVVEKVEPKKTMQTPSSEELGTAFDRSKAPALYGQPMYSRAEVEVLKSLSQRREVLEAREKEIAKREALLKAAEAEVDRKVSELVKIKGELKQLLEDQSNLQKERVQSLVKIYEGMKPKQAARIFDTLEMDILLAVMGKMSERRTSPILANMDTEKARKVTIKLAEQHQLPELPEDGKKQ